jgi:hypothetical protein
LYRLFGRLGRLLGRLHGLQRPINRHQARPAGSLGRLGRLDPFGQPLQRLRPLGGLPERRAYRNQTPQAETVQPRRMQR